ncbi:MAG: hypothetical protein IKO26_10460 [Paludibacteraceae bacterium]|nr:hypothetical protein [Paludibacteraceae bacterium]
MKKLLLYLFLLAPAWLLAAKPEIPDWVNPIAREELYPAGVYYTGFASTAVSNGEDKEKVYDRVRQNARVEAVASIQVSVEQTVERYMQNIQAHGDVSTTDIMTSQAATRTSIKDIPGLKVELWENLKTGDVCAFAWVKTSNLSRQLMRRIAANHAKAEVEMESIEAMVERGDKIQAKNSLPKVRTLLDDIENDQRVMLSIDAGVTDEDLAIGETNLLKKRYQTLSADLKNGINIYLICDAYLFGQSYTALKGEIQGALSPMGCTFVRTDTDADWIITVTATAREYNASSYGSVTTYFAYVDAKISMEKSTTRQRIYEDAISEKGGHTHNYEQAARQAYKDLSSKISTIIKDNIQQ